MKIRKVAAAGWFRYGPSMGTLVEEGYMTKDYRNERHDPDARTVIWTLNADAPFAVDNGVDPLIKPGQTAEWEK